MPPALEAQKLNHWTARDALDKFLNLRCACISQVEKREDDCITYSESFLSVKT